MYIGLRQLQVERRLLLCLVLRLHNAAGYLQVIGIQTGALPGLSIHAIKCASSAASEGDTESFSHGRAGKHDNSRKRNRRVSG